MVAAGLRRMVRVSAGAAILELRVWPAFWGRVFRECFLRVVFALHDAVKWLAKRGPVLAGLIYPLFLF